MARAQGRSRNAAGLPLQRICTMLAGTGGPAGREELVQLSMGKIIPMEQRRQEVLDAIEDSCNRYNRIPSYAELAARLHCSKGTIFRVIASLREEGLISRKYENSSILPKHMEDEDSGVYEVPCLDSISCGRPEDAMEDPGEYIRMVLPPGLSQKGRYYALKTHGDSMIDIGIEDGTLVLIDPKRRPRRGDIVVALVGGTSTTLKRFEPQSDGYTVHLVPENVDMDPIVVDTRVEELDIQGVAVMMQKMLI